MHIGLVSECFLSIHRLPITVKLFATDLITNQSYWPGICQPDAEWNDPPSVAINRQYGRILTSCVGGNRTGVVQPNQNLISCETESFVQCWDGYIPDDTADSTTSKTWDFWASHVCYLCWPTTWKERSRPVANAVNQPRACMKPAMATSLVTAGRPTWTSIIN